MNVSRNAIPTYKTNGEVKMNLIPVLLMSSFLFINSGTSVSEGNGGELMWTNFSDGVKQADSSNKKILIDVYTDWCGWCKRMDSDTYTDEGVKKYLSEKYVLVKLNAESDAKETVRAQEITDAQLAHAFRVDGYPTTVFLGHDGTFITKVPGYLKPAEFLQVLKYIGDDYYTKMSFQDYLKMQDTPGK